MSDFNIHICHPSDAQFLNFLESLNFVLHPTGPTHDKGHILDLVLSYGLKMDSVGYIFSALYSLLLIIVKYITYSAIEKCFCY